jgi:DNA-binding NtrC family response regulator
VARVLIVDDEPNLLDTLAAILRHKGYEVATCPDAERALAVMKAERFEAVLADFYMPGGGEAVVEAARRLQPQALMVLITGQLAAQDIAPTIRAHADAVMFKPLEVERLLTLLGQRLR